MQSIRLRSGVVLGRYEVQRAIGSGSSGMVYEAMDRSLGRRVALKVLNARTDDGDDDPGRARFLREARAASQIRHPNVVDVFDAGIHDGLPFLVMELIEGETLAQLLRREGPLDPAQAVELLLPIASAVAKLHANGIVHRDLKPANILLEGTGGPSGLPRPKLADFGLSRFAQDAPSITYSGAILGTPEYMAPELTRAKEKASERTDQYALGVLLYECVTGDTPFAGGTAYEIMHAALNADLPPPSSREASLTRAFDAVVLRAMQRDAGQRFPSVEAFGEALVPFASEAVAARWRSEFAPPRISVAPPGGPNKTGRPSAAAPVVESYDGVARAMRGDFISILWNAPARIHRANWVFDAATQLAAANAGGIVTLKIILPASTPPDRATVAAGAAPLRAIRGSLRHTVVVVLGDALWQSVVRGVMRALIPGRWARRLVLVSSVAEGIDRALEEAGPTTPGHHEVEHTVQAMYAALDLVAPDFGERSAPRDSQSIRRR